MRMRRMGWDGRGGSGADMGARGRAVGQVQEKWHSEDAWKSRGKNEGGYWPQRRRGYRVVRWGSEVKGRAKGRTMKGRVIEGGALIKQGMWKGKCADSESFIGGIEG
jgi:hypothetical protein